MKNLLLCIEHIFVFINKLIDKITDKTRPAHVLVYLSYSNGTSTRVMGRVVEKISPTDFSSRQRHLSHFVKVIKLFLAKKIKNAKLQINAKQFSSNEEGFFSEVIPATPGSEIEINLVATKSEDISIGKHRFQVPVLEIPKKVDKIFISDIDDTIIKSKAVSMKSLIVKTLFSPLSKREAFDEASKFYNKLANIDDKESVNQFFYVSSSTWNLYPLLTSFLRTHAFPKGPLLLQDIATEKKKDHSDSHQHKSDRIKEILDFYPESKYILIGDAGQRDAPIYLDIAKEFPNNIELILIRHTWWTKELIEPTEYIQRAQELGVPIVYFENLENLDATVLKILGH